MSDSAGYAYVWTFTVRPEQAAAFEAAYGPGGAWAVLFRRAEGYVRTELHRDRADPARYLTIDYWTSESAWRAFRERFAREYESVDAACAAFTVEERAIGQFEPVG